MSVRAPKSYKKICHLHYQFLMNMPDSGIYCHHYPHRVLTMHPHVCSLHSHTPHTVLTGSFRFPQTVKSRLINSREVGGGAKVGLIFRVWRGGKILAILFATVLMEKKIYREVKMCVKHEKNNNSSPHP